MTHDSHTRIREDGTVQALPALEEMYVGSEDPEEQARLESEFFQRNREIGKLLEAKGFGLSGDEPLSNQIRRVQMTGEVGEGDSQQGGK